MGCLLMVAMVAGLVWWCNAGAALPFVDRTTPTAAPAVTWHGVPLPAGTRFDFDNPRSVVAVIPLGRDAARGWLLAQLLGWGFAYLGKRGDTDRWAKGGTTFTVEWGPATDGASRAKLTDTSIP